MNQMISISISIIVYIYIVDMNQMISISIVIMTYHLHIHKIQYLAFHNIPRSRLPELSESSLKRERLGDPNKGVTGLKSCRSERERTQF